MPVFVESNNIISSLGFSTNENFKNVYSGKSGIKPLHDVKISTSELQTSIIGDEKIDNEFFEFQNQIKYTKFEKICILSISKALQNSIFSLKSPKTILILATTKGNIDLLGHTSLEFTYDRVYLWKSAKVIADFFNAVNTPLVVSNACISGVSAMILAKRLLDAKIYENAVIVGADIISKFTVSGFQSFLSLSSKKCKPFDISRDGLNLGEAAATIILTNQKTDANNIELAGGAISNDANHISGPSRTGEGLFNAINSVLKSGQDVDFISAHATATQYNDNMESVAISRKNMNNVLVNGLKGYFGHTLGAAGVLETIISLEAMNHNVVLKTMGFNELGVSEQIYVTDKNIDKNINSFLKIASGFGGCNAAALFIKHY